MYVQDSDEINLVDYIRVVRKRWKIIIIMTVVPMVISYIVLLFVPNVYESVALLKFAYSGDKPLETVDTTNAILKFPTSPYLKEVAVKLNFPALQSQYGMITSRFSLEETAGLVKLRTTGDSPEESVKLTKIIIQLITLRQQKLYEREKKILESSIKLAEQQIIIINKEIDIYNNLIKNFKKDDPAMKTVVSIGYSDVKEKAWIRHDYLIRQIIENRDILENKMAPTEIIGEPVVIETPVSPKRLRVIIISMFAGFLLGVLYSFIIESIEKERRI